IVLLAMLVPILPLADPLETNIMFNLEFPSAEHLLGTDSLGRDILSRILHGARPALFGALIAVVTAIVIGAITGIVAGFHGGLANAMASRLADLIFSIPALVVLLALAAVFGPSTVISMLSFG